MTHVWDLQFLVGIGLISRTDMDTGLSRAQGEATPQTVVVGAASGGPVDHQLVTSVSASTRGQL
jgi:hypothetical protein